MGYSFYLISKAKDFTEKDFEAALSNLSPFNRGGDLGILRCDVFFNVKYITISGSFGISGKYAEGFVMDLLLCFQELGYKIKVLSKDWSYGSDSDWQYLKGFL